MSEDRFATEADFVAGRKLVGFRVEISDDACTIEQAGVVGIAKDPRNNELRSMYGSISHVELGVLRLQSSSAQHFAGYLVDYAENEVEAEKAAIAQAISKRQEFIVELQTKLEKFQNQVLTKIVKTKCVC
jgi:hypothetical protein